VRGRSRMSMRCTSTLPGTASKRMTGYDGQPVVVLLRQISRALGSTIGP
jgi:hypothetical protein